jgi:pseudaminic acid cytidylyltransferase
MTIAIIPARGKSRRIPRKNIMPFHGKPIIQYSIEAARDSMLFTHVVVSTEDEEIRDIAIKLGAGTINRMPQLAEDDVGTQEVARDAIMALHKNNVMSQVACVIYPAAPLLTAVDLTRGLAELLQLNKPFAYAAGARGADPELRDCGQFYWGHTWAFLGRLPLYEYGAKVKIPNDRAIDINTPEDWAEAERVYKLQVAT